MSDWFIHTCHLTITGLLRRSWNHCLVGFILEEQRCLISNIYLLPELAPDVAEPLHPVEAHCLKASVAQHLRHLWYVNCQLSGIKGIHTSHCPILFSFLSLWNLLGHTPGHPPWRRALSSSPRSHSSPSSCSFLPFLCSSASWTKRLVTSCLFACKTFKIWDSGAFLVASSQSKYKMQDRTSLNLRNMFL